MYGLQVVPFNYVLKNTFSDRILGAWNCNFPALLANYDRQTEVFENVLIRFVLCSLRN